MKLMCLNIWGGNAGHEPLLEFFRKYKDVDIFCLQEVWQGGRHLIGTPYAGGTHGVRKNGRIGPELFDAVDQISKILPGHQVYFRPIFGDFYGMLMLLKKDYSVLEEGEEFIYKDRGYVSPDNIADHSRNLHYIRLQTPTGIRLIAHLHGLWNGKGKSDSEDRLLQSDRALTALKRFSDPLVLCGDFNLTPDTESLKKFENAGLRNLITEYGITSTRSHYYDKPIKFADYVFVSTGVQVNDFRVLPDAVSDHLPLSLDFE